MTTIFKTSLLTIVLMSTVNITHANTGKKTYDQVCSMCHASGASGSPEFGDKFAWKSRIAKGKKALYSSAIRGFGGMPSRGGKSSLTDDEVKAAVDYIISKSS